MIKKNDELLLDITSYTSEGYGVGKHNCIAVFVPFALEGEQVLVHIIKVARSYAIGKIVKILKRSDARIEPSCKFYQKCGGCDLQHVSYDQSLKIKQQIVKDAFAKLGGLKVEVEEVCESQEFMYRNKIAVPLCTDDNAQVSMAMYRKSSHNAVVIDECLLAHKEITEICKQVVELLSKYFEEKEVFKHLVVRKLKNGALITIVSSKALDARLLKKLFAALSSKFESLNLGLYTCKKLMDNNVILEGNIKHVAGIKNIEIDVLGINVEIAPLSFFQVNFEVMQKLYQKVLEQASGYREVIDAYSGAGLLSALLAKTAKHVYGIEIVKEAVENANNLKLKNNIKNLTNICKDAKDALPKLINEHKDALLVLDPPRKGVDKSVIEAIKNSKPVKIIYISCNPATLARDAKLLSECYDISYVKPFDMFSKTSSVETLCVFTLKL